MHLVFAAGAVFDAVANAGRGQAGAGQGAGKSLLVGAGLAPVAGHRRFRHPVAGFAEAAELVGAVGAVVDAVAGEPRVDAVAVVAPKHRRSQLALFQRLVVLAAIMSAHVEHQAFAAAPGSVPDVVVDGSVSGAADAAASAAAAATAASASAAAAASTGTAASAAAAARSEAQIIPYLPWYGEELAVGARSAKTVLTS